MKILDIRWFNKVGIVRIEDQYEGIKYYIGALGRLDDPHSADDYDTENEDAIHIAHWGNTFPKDAGDVLFGVK